MVKPAVLLLSLTLVTLTASAASSSEPSYSELVSRVADLSSTVTHLQTMNSYMEIKVRRLQETVDAHEESLKRGFIRYLEQKRQIEELTTSGQQQRDTRTRPR